MLLRFTQEATPWGYMKDAKALHDMDTKEVAQDEKRDKPRTSGAPQKPQFPVQNCTISRGDMGCDTHGWKARQV
jgi:hypothetical protein